VTLLAFAVDRRAAERPATTAIDRYYRPKQNWFQFLFYVKATALKQQIRSLLKFYPPIISTEASYHIYTSQWPVTNVKANFCAYNVRIKF